MKDKRILKAIYIWMRNIKILSGKKQCFGAGIRRSE